MRRAAGLALLALGAASCDREPVREAALVPGGEAARAPAVVRLYGCGSCHVIPGIRGANGRVGPSLARIGEQQLLAGRIPNTPDNLMRWIVDPHALVPGTAMPATGISAAEARDVAAYLYRLR